jgi:Ca2+-binding RTX toxin-like protein
MNEHGGRWLVRMVAVVALVVSSVAVSVSMVAPDPASAAIGDVNFIFDAPGTPARYGANQIVRVEAGNINFVRGCTVGTSAQAATFPDFIQATADVYIVSPGRNWTNNTPLVDIAGAPNSVFGSLGGGFFNLALGLTGPAGKISSGTYDVIVDECQNGVWDTGQDTVIRDAFTVDIDQEVPGLDTAAAEWFAMKDAARSQVTFQGNGQRGINPIERLYLDIAMVELGSKLASTVTSTPSAVDIGIGIVKLIVPNVDIGEVLRERGKAIIKTAAGKRRLALENLAQDPPDPAFQQFATPVRTAPYVTYDAAELTKLEASASLFDALGATEEAFLSALERYQGAQQAGNVLWAARHARTLVELADLHAELNAAFISSFDALVTPYITASTSSPLWAPSIALRDRINQTLAAWNGTNYSSTVAWWNSGLTRTETDAALAEYRRLDDTPATADSLVTVSGNPGTAARAKERADLGTALSDAMQALVDAQVPGLLAELDLVLGDDMDDPDVSIAEVVGAAPAATVEVAIDVPAGVVPAAVGWDLDGDGQFDDATGATASWTLPGDAVAGSLAVIGVEVQTASGVDTAVRAVPVGPGNQPPTIVADGPTWFVNAGTTTETISATISDPDGDSFDVDWFIDGALAQAGGSSLDVTPAAGFYGQLEVTAIAVDEHGGRATQIWQVQVRGTDGDGDGYLANPGPDCDDTNSAVRPLRDEVTNNGIDDDCDPSTPDTFVGNPGTPSPQLFSGVEGDVFETAITNWNHPDRLNNVPFTMEVEWGDGETTTHTVQGTTSSDTNFELTHRYRREVTAGFLSWCLFRGADTSGTLIGCRNNEQSSLTNSRVIVSGNGPFVNAADFRTWSTDRSGAINPATCQFVALCNAIPDWGWFPTNPEGRGYESIGNPNEDMIGFSPVELSEGGYGRAMVELAVPFGVGDDDFMGMVLGYQDDEAGGLNGADDDYLMFSWAGRASSDISATTMADCGGAPFTDEDTRDKSATWSRVRGPATYVERLYQMTLGLDGDNANPLCSDEFGVELLQEIRQWPVGTPNLRTNERNVQYLRWARMPIEVRDLPVGPVATPYRFTVDYRPNRLRMWAPNGVLVTDIGPPDSSDPFPPGALGVYSQSMAGVRTQATAPEPAFSFTEGSPGSITMPFTDGGTDETYTVVIDWGDGTSATSGTYTADEATGYGWYTAAGEHTYQRAGEYRGEVCVTDDTADGTCFTFRATVANLPPVVDAGPDVTGAPDLIVGAEFSLDEATFTDPGAFDDHTATIDWGDGSPVEAGVVTQNRSSGGTVTGTHVFAADGNFEIEVCVTDQLGLSDCDTLTVDARVTPVAPTVTLDLPETATINTLVPIGGGVDDPNPDDGHTFTLDIGDGTGPVPAVGRTIGTFAAGGLEVTYTMPGTYTIEFCATDSSGLTGCDTGELVVLDDGTFDQPPTADAGGPYTMIEGGTVSLDASASSDPGGEDLTAAWDLDGDGTFEATGLIVPFSAPDGPASLPVSVEVCDTGGQCDVASATVEVANAAPVVDSASASVDDTTVTLDVVFSDAGVEDSHTVTVDWGDGTAPDEVVSTAPGGGALVFMHEYVAGATYEGTVTVVDDDGGTASAAFQVVVGSSNQTPIADAGGPYLVAEGSSVTLDASASSDPDGDVIEYEWDLDGDGAFEIAGIEVEFDAVEGPAVQVVTVQVCDPVGSCASSSATVEVTNVAPSIDGVEVDVDDTTATLSVVFSDVGVEDSHTVTVDWGDGTDPDEVVSTTPGGGTLEFAHDYAPGETFAGTVTVVDNDGGTASAPFQVVVGSANQTPIADAGGPYLVAEGSSVTLDASASFDPDGGVIEYAWDLDGDGVFEAPGFEVEFDAIEGPADVVVTVQVCDPSGSCASASATVEVTNVAPSIDSVEVDVDASTATLSVVFSDAGVEDSHTVTVDWGDGSAPDEVVSTTPGGDTLEFAHEYAAGATYEGTVSVVDDDGGSTSETFEVTTPPDVGTGDPCLDLTPTIVGTNGKDVIFGTHGDDVIFALGGDDIVFGLGGNDIICGGPGNDKIRGGNGNDVIRGGPGNDHIWGDDGDDDLAGGDGNDKIWGGKGNDRIFGDDGYDFLFGGLGHDQIFGGAGNDYLNGGPGNDHLDGGPGCDTLVGGSGRDTLTNGTSWWRGKRKC